ncbi:hypothetical protein EGR_02650 [Echinococcus granulosus]|uniref:Uncharacterized protein n=1 Tax=Echinococcus granulosus TaxID=6210 RepID=W6UN48_ECHGR|nr:hypothetical protein EGR_02650 [Echinococcus granulosus]EUB62518.1 hypothetical protein EGR_02650 [Echinococcus granulosus]
MRKNTTQCDLFAILYLYLPLAFDYGNVRVLCATGWTISLEGVRVSLRLGDVPMC